MTTKTQRVEAFIQRNPDLPVPPETARAIALEEDCRLNAYQCTAGVWTCGWGETAGVVPGMVWTQAFADERFKQSLGEWGSSVRAMLKKPANTNEFTALMMLSYNIGIAGLKSSTVLRQHNAGDKLAASRAFDLWNKTTVERVVDGKVVREKVVSKALTARRKREGAIYLTPVVGEVAEDLPQTVEPESSLAKSQISRGGVVAAVAGVAQVATSVIGSENTGDPASAITAVSGMLTTVSSGIQSIIGIPPAALAGAVLVYAGYVVVKWRRRQRTEGWA